MSRRIALALVALLALAGLVGGGPAYAGTAAEDDPMLGAPAVGECYDLTAKQAWKPSTTEKTVDCSEKHTLLIGAVGEIPQPAWDDDDARFRAVKKICDPFWDKYYTLEDPRSYMTLLQGILLYPTEAQQDAGARWVSCEIGVLAGDTLLPLTRSGPPKATRKPADSIARCADANNQWIPCSKRHAWRSTYAFGVKAKGSDTKVRVTLEKAAGRRCGPRTSGETFLWGARPIGGNSYAIVCLERNRR